MKLKKSFLAAILSVMLLLGTAMTASAALVDDLTAALNAAGITQTGAIVDYLQKVNITQANADAVKANVTTVKNIIGSNTAASALTADQKTQIAALMTDSAKILQMKVQFVGTNGAAINLATYVSGSGIKMQILNASGTVLATATPSSTNLQSLIPLATSLQVAADKATAYSATYAAQRGGLLPKTATSYGNFALLGVALILLGAFSYKPIRNLVK